MTSLDFTIIMPEILLAVYALLALLAGAYLGKDRIARTLLWVTVGAFLVLAFYVGIGRPAEGAAFFDMFIADGFSRFCKILILTAAAAVMAMSADYMDRRGMLRFEYPILIALAVCGMMFMVSAGDLLILYLGLELQSLSLYVVAAMRRDSVRSSEAGLKYFVLGSLSSGMLLYGASLVYGFAGTTNFSGIIQVVEGGNLPVGLLFGMVFVIVGLAFKISAVPFHMWTPDVYEGSPTPVTAFFATAPKVAAMALLARVLTDAFGRVPGDWGQILAVLAVLSMFLGSIAGIGQTNIKRLMAYSSIAHMGFSLVGLASGTALGVQSMLIYMAIYAVMNVGVFAWILSLERDGQPVTDLASLHRFASAQPLKGFAVLILMFSLAGVPPMLGFFAKFAVLTAAVDAGMGWLAVLGVIASVIGAFYYLRIVYYMYFGKEAEPVGSRMGVVSYGLLIASATAVLLGSITMFGVDRAAGRAAESLMIVDTLSPDSTVAAVVPQGD
ncbi:NADH-quinone oxidoreductase subunit NuoN [Paracoccus aerodenitrificans]|uniref:NADH-quinone oxidoreductase subunit NuoN n=1 Tax=Paracoccus aerodenitrificans TaxID=3017781 RepID=UPI0022F0C4B9|nr:NADH-quinone oxidoreductase subunit NuoN [Paracoccus aerodenitrificans]WBU63175.1 NADH-quinone oxidoreductase subunit NuoN [Paracoccus aerodenitrificans]